VYLLLTNKFWVIFLDQLKSGSVVKFLARVTIVFDLKKDRISFEIHEYILLDLGLIAEEELNAWVEQKIARQQQQVKDERYAHFLKLKKEFENDK
jgi:hypothetical protein